MSIKSYIDDAILNGKAVTIKYIKYSGEYSTRKISDIHYSNEYGEGGDYIEAFCHKRQERRTFKISRIVSVDGISDTPVSSGPKQPKSAYTGNTTTGSNYSSSPSTARSTVTPTYKPSYSSSNYSSSSTRYSSSSNKKSEGCYIATMAYGDYDHPQVLVLRKYRDTILKQSVGGRLFIRIYYWTSPKLVKILSGHEKINRLIRYWLDRKVVHISQSLINK